MNQGKTNPGPDGEGLVDPLLGPRHLGPHQMALKYSRAHPHQRGPPSTLQEPVPLVNQPPHRTNPLSLPESQSAGAVSDSDDDSLDGQPEMSGGGAGARNARKKAKAASKKTRGRVKIKVEFIDNKLRRYTTFSKRKTGIMKKAYELSTLTGTQVMLLVASETGHVYTFATPKLQPMITSEAGKTLIQTCLNSPDQPGGGGAGGGQTGGQGGTSAVEPDQRMNPTGYEETELTYNVPEETVSASGGQGQKGGGFEDGIDTECGLDDQPLPGPSRRNTDYVNEGSETEEGDEVDEVQNDQPIALVKKTPNKKSPDSPPPIRSPKKKVRVSPAAVITPTPPALPSQRATLTGVSAIPAESQSRINPPQLIHPPAAAASGPLRSTPARLQIQPSSSPVVIAVNQQPTPVQAPLMVPTVAPTPQAQPSSASAFLSSSGPVTLHQPQHLQVRQHIGHIVKPDGTVVSIQAPPPTAMMASPPPILLNSPPAGFSANSPVPLVLVQPQQTPPQHHHDAEEDHLARLFTPSSFSAAKKN